MEEEMAADIESVVADQSILKEPIREARQSKIQGEHAQSQVIDLLNNHDALYRLCKYEYKQRQSDEPAPIVPVADHLASEGYLDGTTKDEFSDFWDDIDWIVPSVSIPLKNLGGIEEHWSDIAMKPKPEQPELMEYTMRWGVDEQLEADIPGERILSRAVFELDFIIGYFQYWQDNDDVSDDMVSYLAEEYDLAWTTDMLRNVLADLESIEHGGGQLSSASNDPDVEVTWNDTASDENVVGTIRVTPPGEQMKRDEEDDDDEGDTPPRGFQ